MMDCWIPLSSCFESTIREKLASWGVRAKGATLANLIDPAASLLGIAVDLLDWSES